MRKTGLKIEPYKSGEFDLNVTQLCLLSNNLVSAPGSGDHVACAFFYRQSESEAKARGRFKKVKLNLALKPLTSLNSKPPQQPVWHHLITSFIDRIISASSGGQ